MMISIWYLVVAVVFWLFSMGMFLTETRKQQEYMDTLQHYLSMYRSIMAEKELNEDKNDGE